MESDVKRVVSVSIGSSRRDAKAEVEVLGQKFLLERIGTDGSLEKAAQLFRDLDGKVAAFGLGGTDLYFIAGKRRYSFRDILQLAGNAKLTPVLDGSGLKHTLEREAVRQLEPLMHWKGKKVLMVAAVDRFGMAEALSDAGADMIYGDMIFSLGLPVPIRTIGALRNLAYTLLPILTRLPFKWFAPTGAQQDKPLHDYRVRYYNWADVIAGDFPIINRYRPAQLPGKTIMAQTITPADREALRAAGLARLVTTTPQLNGRNFGTNVMEAFFVALSGKNRALTPDEYMDYIRRVNFKPQVWNLQAPGGPVQEELPE
ncbi:MAG TPA: quinate 5-dehydrogenase [Deinococcales bacterium]|nr:quinate 5-dehydrogenase [Deinococcales bacterium]